MWTVKVILNMKMISWNLNHRRRGQYQQSSNGKMVAERFYLLVVLMTGKQGFPWVRGFYMCNCYFVYLCNNNRSKSINLYKNTLFNYYFLVLPYFLVFEFNHWISQSYFWSYTVPLKCKLPPSRATRIASRATGIASRATKKKLQVHYVGLLRDLNWPFVIIFEKGTQLIEYPLRSEPISVFSVLRLHLTTLRSGKNWRSYTKRFYQEIVS